MRRLLRFQNSTVPVACIHKILWHRKNQTFSLFDKDDNTLGSWNGEGEWQEVKKEYDVVASFIFNQNYQADFDVLVTAAAEPIVEDGFLVMSVKRELTKDLIEACAS